MSELNKDKQLKFQDGSKNEVQIVSMGQEDMSFGTKYVVHIQETIDGYNHFLPSNGLISKLKEISVVTGDKVVIEKVPPSEKYQYGYFSVSRSDEVKDSPPAQQDTKPQGSIDKLAVHELTLRVKTLEDQVQLLMKKDGDLPF